MTTVTNSIKPAAARSWLPITSDATLVLDLMFSQPPRRRPVLGQVYIYSSGRAGLAHHLGRFPIAKGVKDNTLLNSSNRDVQKERT